MSAVGVTRITVGGKVERGPLTARGPYGRKDEQRWGLGRGEMRGAAVRGSISKKRPSHYKFKSPKQFQ